MMNKYHPFLVALHWILALMVAFGLMMGGNVLSETPNSDPEKVFYLRMHMSMGMAISIMAGLPDIVFGGSGAPLPESFDDLPPRVAHGMLAIVLTSAAILGFLRTCLGNVRGLIWRM